MNINIKVIKVIYIYIYFLHNKLIFFIYIKNVDLSIHKINSYLAF